MALTPKPRNSVTVTPWDCLDLYTPAQAADSSAGCKLHRVGWHRVQSVGLLYTLRLMLEGEDYSTRERWCLQCGRGIQHRDPVGCPPSSLPRATDPRLPVSLVCFTVSWNPGWVAVKEILCIGPLRGTCVSSRLLSPPWWTESPLIFAARCYIGTTSWLLFSRLGSPVWGRDPMFLRGSLRSWDIPQNLSHCPWEQQPFSHLLPVLMWFL